MTITPGPIADLPNDDYHAQTEWWSSTQLKGYLPEQYKPFSGASDALTFGTLFHEVVLEPDTLGKYVPLDPELIGVKADGSPAQVPTMTAAWKRAVAEVEAGGKTVVALTDWDRAHRMRDAIATHPVAADLMFGSDGVNEESAFWVDHLGVQHKARFDRRIPGALLDLKSTSAKPGWLSLSRAVVDYGYELSAAHYLEVAAGLRLDADRFLHVWVEKAAPYRVTVTELDDTFIARGNNLRDLALSRATGDEEPYEGATTALPLTCPAWAMTDDLEITF